MQNNIRNIGLLSLLLLSSLCINAQIIFKTIVPHQPVTVGESFSVQYVLEDIDKNDGFTAPAFNGFKLISGPYIYKGKNIVFTLVALKPGTFVIPGATAKINGQFFKSDDVTIQVVSKPTAFEKAKDKNDQPSEYFLGPGEDPYEKIRKNLFMKVMVDKKSCYVGQPVIATFKLYSRLESRSDIVKNPGFYGFTVQDIISLNDNISSIETINGKPFDVHTVRMVQLYSLQPGTFIIDPMEVTNKVEFSKSAVSRKTEQEITEGVFENNDHNDENNNTVIYENNISTEKIAIKVKPYPEKNKPALFNSATGNFSIYGKPDKNELAKNEQSFFTITIRGKGNFTQISPLVIQWPAGIEAFEPAIKDSLDKTQIPLGGSRTFRYSFISGKEGNYIIPAVSFSFFDPDSNKYKTVSSQPAVIKISSEQIKKTNDNATRGNADKKHYTPVWITGVIILLIVLLIVIWLSKRKKQNVSNDEYFGKEESTVSVQQVLQPAQFSLVADDGRFYSLLQKGIWDFLSAKLKLSGSKMNKYELFQAMSKKGFNEDVWRKISDVLEQCEASMFTQADLLHDKEELLNKTKEVLEQL